MRQTNSDIDAMDDAVAAIERYVTEVTGKVPTHDEIARALKRYFVLKEITDHIVMEWEGDS